MEYLVDENEPLYSIGVVSKILDLPEWTLRALDRAGIVCPQRTEGGTRLYSNADLKKLKYIAYLIKEEKVNINGIRIIIKMWEEQE
ncbi:MAG: MerR family transcriptional regulator [Candidatus Omnitrophota bacterium]|nr:MerR family transcriptional regulator [Candidatus Omnitrophota bacterium]RKY36545.1 MAG: MerR family transcriptional regulator [Candidatus Omnitrophota bacterium]